MHRERKTARHLVEKLRGLAHECYVVRQLSAIELLFADQRSPPRLSLPRRPIRPCSGAGGYSQPTELLTQWPRDTSSPARRALGSEPADRSAYQ